MLNKTQLPPLKIQFILISLSYISPSEIAISINNESHFDRVLIKEKKSNMTKLFRNNEMPYRISSRIR